MFVQDVIPFARGRQLLAFAIVALLSCLLAIMAALTFHASWGDSAKPRLDFGKLSFSFVPNEGLASEPARFVAGAPVGTLSFTPGGVSIAIAPRRSAAVSKGGPAQNL